LTGFASFGRWRLFLGWWAATALAGGVGCALPMLKTLGYEYSLLISLISSAGAGQLAACYPHQALSRGARFPAAALYFRALAFGLVLLAAPLALSLLNRFRVPPCNEVEGLLFFLLMPVCSVAIAAAFGLLSGVLLPRSGPSSVLWFAFFLGSLAGAFHAFYSSPAVFVFGPFFGYFPGVLYDELVSVEVRLVTYRVATLAEIATVIALICWLVDPASLRLSWKRLGSRPGACTTAGLFFLFAVGMYLAGPKLGHRTERSDLEELLDRKVKKGRLDLFFPRGTDLDTVNALTEDAAFSLYQVERYLGTTSDKRVAVFFFSGASQKAAAMGAAGTNVAKPWRSEVYVTLGPVPHEVLRHEIVHAVAADLGSGPFAVPGAFGGLLPDPGRIEGLAVAAQGQRGDLTVHQWAAAMKRLGLLPSIDSVFGLGFFNLAASTAYTAAGSFCSWIHDTYGREALTTAYRTGGWEAATGRDIKALEAGWLASLDGIPLRDEDLAAAEHRFDRAAVIHSVCVHEVAKLRAEAERLSDAGSWDRAFDVYTEAHGRSGGSTSTLISLFYALVDSGKIGEARGKAADLLKAPEIDSVNKAFIEEILSDFDLADNRNFLAKTRFDDLSSRARDESDRRRLQVKARLALYESPSIRRALQALAWRPGQRAVPQTLAMLAIAESSCEMPDNPILSYLVARQHFNLRDWGAAIAWLDKAEERGLTDTTASIHLEARMLKAEATFHLGRFEEARALFGLIASDVSVRQGLRARARDWEERSAFHAEGRYPAL
jgi:hypothetical protein